MRLLSLPIELSFLLALSLAIAIWQRQSSTRGRRTFVLLCLAVCTVALGEWLVVRGLANEVIGDRIKYAGSLALAPLWIGFCAQVAGLGGKKAGQGGRLSALSAPLVRLFGRGKGTEETPK